MTLQFGHEYSFSWKPKGGARQELFIELDIAVEKKAENYTFNLANPS